LRGPGAEGGSHGRLIAGILLAAGRSSRFGRQKLLEPFRGEPLVRRSARHFIESGLSPVIAVVPGQADVLDALSGLPLILIENRQPELGISHSIGLGLGALPSTSAAALIGVADQPFLTPAALLTVARAFSAGLIAASRYGDHRGNPAVFDRSFFPDLLTLKGDRGGLSVIEAHAELVVDVELSPAMGLDVDRPEDWPAE
jgi:molybdenum cofactor cytidylyltransferase